jgi:hypothetical protein
MTATTYSERGLNTLLSNEEKRELSKQARAAYKIMEGNGATDEKEAEFRHRLSIQACGRRISEALRGDYAAISSAFLSIGGQPSRAFMAAMKGETEGKRIALAKLTAVLKSQGRDVSYASRYIWNISKCSIDDAPAKVIWRAFYEFNGGDKKRTGRRKVWRGKKAVKEGIEATGTKAERQKVQTNLTDS